MKNTNYKANTKKGLKLTMKNTRIILLTLCMSISFALCACGDKNTSGKADGASSVAEKAQEVIDYGDAESFEAALCDGENLEGKIVQFVAEELKPQSAFGYNIYAGEHLNFVSPENPDVKTGETVTVKATSVESTLGSWIISYEKVDNAVVDDNTITANS